MKEEQEEQEQEEEQQQQPVCTFLGHLSFPWPGGGVDVPDSLEVDVLLHRDEVRGELPHVLPVVDDGDHGFAAREEVPVGGETRGQEVRPGEHGGREPNV